MTIKRRIASSSRRELSTTRPELLRVQAVELADVAVQRTDRDDGAGIEPARSDHRRERVEVGVPVGGDDLLGPHRLIVPPSLRRQRSWRLKLGSDPGHVHNRRPKRHTFGEFTLRG